LLTFWIVRPNGRWKGCSPRLAYLLLSTADWTFYTDFWRSNNKRGFSELVQQPTVALHILHRAHRCRDCKWVQWFSTISLHNNHRPVNISDQINYPPSQSRPYFN
jgi:hypothetical protein